MDLIFESVMNLLGFGIGLSIGTFAYRGYSNVGSPTLLRLTFAFLSISLGFLILWAQSMVDIFALSRPADVNSMLVIGLGFQALGYFFLAFSHSIQSLKFKHMAPAFALISLAIAPLFVIPGNSIEHIIRSISFILLVYGATQTMTSYMWSKNRNTLIIASGLALLALGEFIGWYNFIYPGSMFYYASIIVKIAGISAIFVPLYRFPMGRIKVGSSV
ncbi:MAG: hypothetical protein ACE5J2_04400 [Nitrososphaerales archaeon]